MQRLMRTFGIAAIGWAVAVATIASHPGSAAAADAPTKPVPPVNADGEGLGLGGYDPVAYFVDGKPRLGKAQHTHRHDSVTYRFATEENRKRFIQNPGAYLPQYGGYCAWAVSEGYTAPIDPKAWKIVEGKLYLNYDQDVQRDWEKDIPGRIRRADANWPKLTKPAAKR